MVKKVDEILTENEALQRQAELKERLIKLTKDEAALQSMSTEEIRAEIRKANQELQRIEKARKLQKRDIREQDPALNASIKKLEGLNDERRKELDITRDTVLGLTKDFPGMGNAALGAAIAAVTGFKGLNKAVTVSGKIVDEAALPFMKIDADIRGAFGRLTTIADETSENAGKPIKTMAGEFAEAEKRLLDMVRSSARGLNAQGTNMEFFSANSEEATKQVREGLSELREAFKENIFVINQELKEAATGKQLILLRNMLGATQEDMGTLGSRAQIMGSTVAAQAGAAKMAAEEMAEAFGMTGDGAGKIISKTMNVLRNDFRNFGTFSESQLAKVSAQALKLGISLEGIKKLNMFDDFDKAAESAAMLGQSFGLNIDAFDLFMEEDPTERLRMIQEAASQAGLDIANMSRVEMNYLADLTGMGVEDTMKALSDSGLELQSQLGEVPDVAETAAEQTAKLIDAQSQIAGLLTKYGADLKPAIDSSNDLVKNQVEAFKYQGRSFREYGEIAGSEFLKTLRTGIEAATSPGAKAMSKFFGDMLLGRTAITPEGERQIPGAIQSAAGTARGMIGVAPAAGNILLEALKEDTATGKKFEDIFNDPNSSLRKALKELTKGAQGLGAAVTGQQGGGGTALGPPGTVPIPEAPKTIPPMLQEQIKAANEAATTPAKPPPPKVDAKPAGSPPAPAGEVEVSTRSDGQGNIRGEANIPAGTQRIAIMIDGKAVGEATVGPIMRSEMPSEAFSESQVGGTIRNAARAQA